MQRAPEEDRDCERKVKTKYTVKTIKPKCKQERSSTPRKTKIKENLRENTHTKSDQTREKVRSSRRNLRVPPPYGACNQSPGRENSKPSLFVAPRLECPPPFFPPLIPPKPGKLDPWTPARPPASDVADCRPSHPSRSEVGVHERLRRWGPRQRHRRPTACPRRVIRYLLTDACNQPPRRRLAGALRRTTLRCCAGGT